MTNWLVGKDSPIFVSATIRISSLPITASARSSNLFLIEFISKPDIKLQSDLNRKLRDRRDQEIS